MNGVSGGAGVWVPIIAGILAQVALIAYTLGKMKGADRALEKQVSTFSGAVSELSRAQTAHAAEAATQAERIRGLGRAALAIEQFMPAFTEFRGQMTAEVGGLRRDIAALSQRLNSQS